MRLGLGAKFTLTVLVILAGTMAANTLYFLRTSSSFHEQQLIERGRALGRLISLVSPEAILGFDFLLLNDYTREVSSQPDVVYGVIVSPQGVPISSYVDRADPLIKQRLAAAKSPDVMKLLQRLDGHAELIQLEFPITHNDVLLGRFLVGMSRQSLQKRVPPPDGYPGPGRDGHRSVPEHGDLRGVPVQRAVSDSQADRRIARGRARPVHGRGSEVRRRARPARARHSTRWPRR